MASNDFERGARAAVEAMDAYFRDENEVLFAGFGSLRNDRGPEVDWRHYTDAEFEDIREGAVRDALFDEERFGK